LQAVNLRALRKLTNDIERTGIVLVREAAD